MSIELTDKARELFEATQKNINYILEIDGVGTFSATVNQSELVYGFAGAVYGGAGLFYGQSVLATDELPYISIQDSTNSLSQQLDQTGKAGGGSSSTVDVAIIDKDEFLTQVLSPGSVIDDILARRAILYVGAIGGVHPKDSIRIYSGIIQDVSSVAGMVFLTVGAPESLKRQTLFVKATAELDVALSDSATTIVVDTTGDFLNQSADESFKTYIRIDDEIIKYEATSANQFLTCTRGQFGTTAVAHDDGASVESVYQLVGRPMDLALKLMLSNADDPSIFDVDVNAYGDLTTEINLQAIRTNQNLERDYGLTVGDFVSSSGSTSNNFSYRAITAFGETAGGYYILVDGAPLTFENPTNGLLAFKSKYDTLPEGLGMTPDQVDVARHEQLEDQFSASFFDYDFRLTDDVDAQLFINEQIYFPCGCYQLTRSARASVGITIPPLAETNTRVIDERNVRNPSKLEIKRSINQNFYNSIVYKYDQDVLSGRFLSGRVTQSADSTNRIKIRNRPLTIEAQGIRSSTGVENIIEAQTRRFLDRYKFGAEYIATDVFFGDGIQIELGDTAVFGSPALKITDIKGGTREFSPRLMECTDRSINFKQGTVNLTFTDTAFDIDGRYGIIGPSSIIGSGSTTTRVRITPSFGNALATRQESFKWEPYIGQEIQIRSVDYSTTETVELVSIDAADPNILIVSPALTSAPTSGMLVDMPSYGTGDASERSLWKLIHCFFNPSIPVVSGSSSTVFTVSAPDAAKLFVGSIVEVCKYETAITSPNVEVVSVVGTTVTVTPSLEFTPDNTYTIELIGFANDEGLPYRFI